jgi:hypothetical protein
MGKKDKIFQITYRPFGDCQIIEGVIEEQEAETNTIRANFSGNKLLLKNMRTRPHKEGVEYILDNDALQKTIQSLQAKNYINSVVARILEKTMSIKIRTTNDANDWLLDTAKKLADIIGD